MAVKKVRAAQVAACGPEIKALDAETYSPNAETNQAWLEDLLRDVGPRSEKRRGQVRHLVSCGERCVLEALIAIGNGQPVDTVLRDFERLAPDTYKQTSKILRGST
jgi:hypothetical protein